MRWSPRITRDREATIFDAACSPHFGSAHPPHISREMPFQILRLPVELLTQTARDDLRFAWLHHPDTDHERLPFRSNRDGWLPFLQRPHHACRSCARSAV